MVSEKMLERGRHRSVIREIFEYGNKRKQEIGEENVFDFSLGNPSVPAPKEVTETLQHLLETVPAQRLHGYTSAAGDPSVRQAVADYVKNAFGCFADPSLVYMTAGAAASLTITLNALIEPGDEVIAFAPYFPEYRVFVEQAGADFVAVPCTEQEFQINRNALKPAITEHTKAVIVNSPNNPTGTVLTEDSIKTLAQILTEKAKQFGHPIYLISDEPYRELVYDNQTVPFLPLYYPDTIVCYSFSKSLSLPGERIGYILVSPTATQAKTVFDAVCGAGRALGFVCAPSLFQQMVKSCLGKTADLDAYDKNRKLLFHSLTDLGFEATYPGGAFYLFMKSPDPDANVFCERARQYELLLVPSDDFGVTGYVRISYCVSTRQIERSIPAFEKLAQEYDLI